MHVSTRKADGITRTQTKDFRKTTSQAALRKSSIRTLLFRLRRYLLLSSTTRMWYFGVLSSRCTALYFVGSAFFFAIVMSPLAVGLHTWIIAPTDTSKSIRKDTHLPASIVNKTQLKKSHPTTILSGLIKHPLFRKDTYCT